MAPEFLGDKDIEFNTKTEVYSYGVLLWEIFAQTSERGQGPFAGL